MSRPIPFTPLLLLLGLGLGACAAPREAAVALPGTADAERALLKSMASVDRAMAGFGGAARPLAAAEPDGLTKPVRYAASGSLDDVARALADSAGYRFATNATTATKPIPVTLDAQSAPVLELLRSLGTQAGADADVRVNQAQRLVEVRHRA